jgi:hypothetical protein
VVGFGGGGILGDRLVASFVAHAAEALAFELGESDAVGGVGDVEVKDGPDEREAAGLAGEPADHFGAAGEARFSGATAVSRPFALTRAPCRQPGWRTSEPVRLSRENAMSARRRR